MSLLSLINKAEKELDKLITRKSKGLEDKGKYRDDWFVKECVTSKQIKSFLTKCIQESYEEAIKDERNRILNLPSMKMEKEDNWPIKAVGYVSENRNQLRLEIKKEINK